MDGKIRLTDGKFIPTLGFRLNFGALGNKLGITLNSSVTRKMLKWKYFNGRRFRLNICLRFSVKRKKDTQNGIVSTVGNGRQFTYSTTKM